MWHPVQSRRHSVIATGPAGPPKGRTMIASFSSLHPSSWKPTSRALGALFAGSAVTLSATLVHGGSLLPAGTETLGQRTTTPVQQQHSPTGSDPATHAERGPAPGWIPDPIPAWNPSFDELPVWRAPLQQPPLPFGGFPYDDHFVPPPPGAVSPGGDGTGSPTQVGPGGARATQPGSERGGPVSPEPPHGGPVDGLLGRVIGATKGVPR